MPTPTAKTHSPHPPANVSSIKSWKYSLAELVFGAGVAAVVLLFGLVVWRLVQLAHPDRPAVKAARSPQGEKQGVAALPLLTKAHPEIVVEGRTEPADSAPVVIPSFPPSHEEKTRDDPSAKEPVDPRPQFPRTWPSDAVVEQRLRARETALRNQLAVVPEVRCLSDLEVRNFRTSQRNARDPVFSRMNEADTLRAEASRNLTAARNELKAARLYLNTNRNNPDAILAERRAVRAESEASIAFDQANNASWLVRHGPGVTSTETAAQQARIFYEINQELHENMTQQAVQAGLALASGPDCQLDPTTAAEMAKLSKELRTKGFVTVPGARSSGRSAGRGREAVPLPDDVRRQKNEKSLQKWCVHRKLEGMSGTVPTLTQMLQIEDEATRLQLVRVLKSIPSAAATTELAVRAIVDLSPVVRQAALDGLEQRPEAQYVPILMRGLRYPWPPVADHAAFALRRLGCRNTVAALVNLLDLPSPSAPVLDSETKRYIVRELVRVNHMRSCLLCHEPSANAKDGLVRGRVPTPGEPLPPTYYESHSGDFVRADITYLRQDFSLVLTDKDAAPWPSEQRYDFVTRLRTLSVPPLEGTATQGAANNYPQREAVLYALRGITGKDGGESSRPWRELLGIAKDERANLDKTINYKDGSLHPSKGAIQDRPRLDRPIARTREKSSD